jgi:DNA-3-methyladenine glycosylase II
MARRLPFSVKRAEEHLRAADPTLARLIDANGPYAPRPGNDPYGWLVRTILFQQLAGSAARAIARKWFALYGDDAHVPTPKEIIGTTDEQFRAAGVSRQKASYFRDLAERMVDGRLSLDGLDKLPDEEVASRLTAVRGVGEWSAHMFLMFELGRPDVLPTGDFGVRHGMQVAYGLDAVPTPARARELGAPWAPYRSVGAWYMWRAVETVTPAQA